MSRDSSMKFTPASVGDTYDKMSQCNHCLKAPTKKPFPMCSACQEASFCSKEYQTKAWPLHKTVCQMRKRSVAAMEHVPSSPEFPPFPIRKRLLTDFIEVHECSFQSAFSSAIILEGGIDKFAYDKRTMIVFLKYRPDCQENPSVAYSIVACTWMSSEEMVAIFGKSPSKSPLELMMESTMRAQHPGYRGMLRAYFKIEDHMIGEAYPQAHDQGVYAALRKTYMTTVDHTKWISRVQQVVRDGLVMRAPGEQNPIMQLGKMKMKKGKWVWVQLTKSEVVELGYSPNFCGLLF